MALLFTDDCFLQHETGRHPESAARLRAISRHLDQTGLAAKFTRGNVTPVEPEVLERVHGAGYISILRDIAERGGGRIETDTVMSRQSYDTALRAAGAAVAAVNAVIAGEHRRAMCLVRPPGHHALPSAAMGFCLFNNVAVAARHAIAAHGLSRVLIVDWDVHHGNGTQDIFEEDAEVYFFSVHRYPFYPGTGAENETGTGAGLGTTFNLPLEFGVSRRDYRAQFHSVLEQAADRCRPELILISAGFDAHAADPVGSLGLDTEDFGTLTDLVLDAAGQHCDGKVVSLLEGGYNVDALAESVGCHLERLLARERND